MTEPEWAHNPVEREIHQREWQRLIKLGKRKSRDESESDGRDRSMTYGPAEPALYRSIETNMEGIGQRQPGESPVPVRRGAMTAIRGGRGGSKDAIWI
jgi:hypothetical protein